LCARPALINNTHCHNLFETQQFNADTPQATMSDDHYDDEDPDVIDVLAISIAPNECAFDAPLDLCIRFATHQHLSDAWWHFSFIVDSACKRHIVELGSSDRCVYDVGEHEYTFSHDGFPVDGVKRSSLLNVGLLRAQLCDGDDDVIDIKMMTQVQVVDGQITRTVFNPLD
jgi:hypothetical protein